LHSRTASRETKPRRSSAMFRGRFLSWQFLGLVKIKPLVQLVEHFTHD
jgi:hypothetical protein